jgi:hypothetical protein
MAKVVKKTVPYEILVRFGEDGAVQGAHVQNREIVEVDGERLRDEVGYALPLDTADFPTQAIMTDLQKATLLENAALKASLAEAQLQLAAQAEGLAQMGTLAEQLTAVQADNEALKMGRAA